ncbi:MAG: tol-pal system-associated acyl-CoA thioesterase [Halochromatium sp.]
MPPPAPLFEWPVRIYYEDTDAGGLVYHARYLHFFERARTEWLRALGFEQARLRGEQGILFAVRKMGLDFVRPAGLDQALRVTLSLAGHRRASIDFEQWILAAGDGHVCCRAEVNIACLDAEHLRPTRIPEAVLNALGASTDRGTNGDIAHGL